jgi:uncharacterized protein (DUF433 family)
MIYPHTTKNPRGVPCIDGTRHRVTDIVADHIAHGYSAAQIVEQYPDLTLAQVHAALTDYYDHQADLEAALIASSIYRRSTRATSIRHILHSWLRGRRQAG